MKMILDLQKNNTIVITMDDDSLNKYTLCQRDDAGLFGLWYNHDFVWEKEYGDMSHAVASVVGSLISATLKENTMKFIAEWKSVEKDGLPEPDENKVYYVLYNSGDGIGTYDYDSELTIIDSPDGQYLKSTKLENKRWRLDFDGSGHEDEINYYFEIIYPDDLIDIYVP